MKKFVNRKSSTLMSSSNLKKALFYIIFSILSIVIILFIFLSLILILIPLRHRIPYNVLPWLYLGVYFVATLVSFILLKIIFNKGKKLFFHTQNTHNAPDPSVEQDTQ